MLFPSTACIVQHKLGAKGAWGFDLSAACSAFIYSLQVGAQFIASGAHKRVLAIGSDVMSSIIDYTDRATCVIFGDGAGAAILEPAENDSEGFIDFIHEVDGSGGWIPLYARWGQPASQQQGNRREENALCAPGWPAGIQVCRAQADRAVPEIAGDAMA